MKTGARPPLHNSALITQNFLFVPQRDHRIDFPRAILAPGLSPV